MWNLTREEQLVLLFLLGAFTIGIGVKLWGGVFHSPEPSSLSPQMLKVEISGAVRKPGWYDLPEGSLVIEGIKRAGGALSVAELEKLNLSLSLKEGEEIWIPGGTININKAPLEQLTYLPGIGPELAKRIIEYRERNGEFRTISELQNVKGIGEIKLQKIKEKITLEEN